MERRLFIIQNIFPVSRILEKKSLFEIKKFNFLSIFKKQCSQNLRVGLFAFYKHVTIRREPFALEMAGSFPEVGQKQKMEKKKKDLKLIITMASYALQPPPRVAHAKPPGPTYSDALYSKN